MADKAIYNPDPNSKDWFDTEFGNACVGFACGVVMIICIIAIFVMLSANIAHAESKTLDNWEIKFFGINYKDFEDRDWKPVAVGVVSSLVAHELGHIVAGELMGMDASFDWNDRVVYADNWQDASSDQKALFAGAGFISQVLVGTVLTAIPATRHSDFTLGFNSFSMVTGFSYGVTGGLGKHSSSDVHNLTDNGYNGTVIAFITSGYTGALSYINLNKCKEELYDPSLSDL